MKSPSRLNPQSGLSLVELMIALTLGTLLMLGVVEIFSGTKATYNMQDGLSRVQENGRVALDLLSRDARLAGVIGCTGTTGVSPRSGSLAPTAAQIAITSSLSNTDPLFGRAIQGVEGYEFTGTGLGQSFNTPSTPALAAVGNFGPALPATPLLQNRPITGSDILILRYVAEPLARILSSNSAASALVLGNNATGERNEGVDFAVALPSGSVFAVSDCRRGRIFQGTRAGRTVTSIPPPGTTVGNVVGFGNEDKYGDSALVGRHETVAYYVGVNAQALPTLYRARYVFSAAGVPAYVHDELVEGVESLQVIYGVGRMELVQRGAGAPMPAYTEQAQAFVTAAELANPASLVFGDGAFATSAVPGVSARALQLRALNIRAVRVSMLIRSPEEVRTDLDTRVYSLFGNTNATSIRIDPPDDRALRETYETTIQLRNQSFGLH